MSVWWYLGGGALGILLRIAWPERRHGSHTEEYFTTEEDGFDA